jgi:hypothetical protein
MNLKFRTLVNSDFSAGDILLFAGDNVVSRGIKLGTVPPWYWFRDHWRNVNHAEICSRFPQRLYAPLKVLAVGSTTEKLPPCLITGKPIAGVQAHLPEVRVARYPGPVYRMRPAPHRFSQRDVWRLAWFLEYWIGKPYDLKGALLAPSMWRDAPHPASAFCSCLCGTAAMYLNLLALSNPRKIAPSRLARDLVWCGSYLTPERIK